MQKRRGNNEGTWRKRTDGTWEYRISLGRTADGKLIRKSFYGKKKADCLTKYDELVKNDFAVIEKKMRVGEWADSWLSIYKSGSVGSSTYNQYRIMVDNFIKPSLIGGMLLDDVRPVQIQAVMKTMQGRSNSYATKLKATLWAIFETAIDNDLCRRNPCGRIKIKAHSPKATSDRYFSLGEIEAILAYTAKQKNHITLAMTILAYTGLRRGELLGLQWDDIDFNAGTLSIRRVVYLEKNSKAVKDTGKTDASLGVIPLLPKLKERLENAPRLSQWIIPDSNGDYHNPKNFSIAYSKCLAEIEGVRSLGTHAFRHSLATHLLAAGVDIRIIQQILRHHDISVTGNTYTDVEISTAKEAMDKLPY